MKGGFRKAKNGLTATGLLMEGHLTHNSANEIAFMMMPALSGLLVGVVRLDFSKLVGLTVMLALVAVIV